MLNSNPGWQTQSFIERLASQAFARIHRHVSTCRAIFVATITLLAGRLEIQVQAVTAWYQPTPYPTKKADGSAMPENLRIVHTWDGWFNNSFNRMLVRDTQLQIGGGGDIYTSPIRFDLTGSPATVDSASLCLFALPSGSANPSQVSLWRINTAWSPSTVGWATFPYVTSSGFYWPISISVNAWRSYLITEWYADWKSGTHLDDGILIWPYNTDGTQRFDKFASSHAAAPADASVFSMRPILRFDFTPTFQLKMPLPGNHKWFVTTEIGGYDCYGNYDSAHDDIISTTTGNPSNNYFSIDFSSRNVADAGATVYSEWSNIPVIAAAGGTVKVFPNASYNGNYIIVTHGSSGFTTRYLHMKSFAPGIDGKDVAQGELLGFMGSTGMDPNTGLPTSHGVHLHFGVRYNDSGAASVVELTKVVMDGWLLKSFQTECSIDGNGVPQNPSTRYYRSGNRVY
jgi:murein DD-endopeptidase MepM/ murein hydrolase activator NlpD